MLDKYSIKKHLFQFNYSHTCDLFLIYLLMFFTMMDSTVSPNKDAYLHEINQFIFNDIDGCDNTIEKGLCAIESMGLAFNFDLDTLLDDSSAMAAFVKLAGSLKNEAPLPPFPFNPQIPAKHLNLLRGLAQIYLYHDLFANNMTFHPYVEAVTQLSPITGGDLMHFQHYYSTPARKALRLDISEYEVLKKIINQYLKIIKSETVRKRIDNIQRGVRENIASIEKHFKALLKNHASLLVIRIDLSYEAKLKNMARLSHITQEQIVEDKKQFLKAVARQFPDWLGYVCKLEFAPKKGYHYHCILYFDGNELRADGLISQALALMWRDVTSIRHGVSFLCNLHKKDYVHLAVGRVHYSESDKIKNFRYISQYLAKNDLFSCVKKNGKRSLEKSQVKARSYTRGRPRTLA